MIKASHIDDLRRVVPRHFLGHDFLNSLRKTNHLCGASYVRFSASMRFQGKASCHKTTLTSHFLLPSPDDLVTILPLGSIVFCLSVSFLMLNIYELGDL